MIQLLIGEYNCFRAIKHFGRKKKMKEGTNDTFEKVQIMDINSSLPSSTNSIVLNKRERKCTNQIGGCVRKAKQQTVCTDN